MDYYGEIVEVSSNYKKIGIGEVGVTSLAVPMVFTSDIQTCVVVLLTSLDCAAMVHVNLEDLEDYSNSLKNINDFFERAWLQCA